MSAHRSEHIPEGIGGSPAMLTNAGPPRSAAGLDQAALASEVTHVVHSWIEQIVPAPGDETNPAG
jgi:hypothetical protein